MGQPVVHFEIGCRDVPGGQQFYAQLFGWQMQAAGPARPLEAEVTRQGIAPRTQESPSYFCAK